MKVDVLIILIEDYVALQSDLTIDARIPVFLSSIILHVLLILVFLPAIHIVNLFPKMSIVLLNLIFFLR